MPDRSRVYDLIFAVVALAALGAFAFLAAGPRSDVRSVFYCVVALVPALVLLQRVWPALAPDARRVKELVIVGILGSTVIVGLLLPPFQGPDEVAHWKLAVSMYRSKGLREWHAYSLPEILDVYPLIFHPERHLDPLNLRRTPEGFIPDTKPQSRRHYSYVRPHSYPVVALVSAFFPRVQSLRQALLFYYVCRFVPIVLLGVLLLLLNRHWELPYTALFFFSLPLVVQQSTVVSSDTFLNLGTAAAVVIYVRLLDRPSVVWLSVLWALVLLVVSSKFIVAALLLLPLSLTPLAALRRRPKIAIAGLVLLAIVAVIATPVLVKQVLQAVRDTGEVRQRLPEVEAQIASVQTWEGLRHFGRGYLKMLPDLRPISAWSGPLGWLDTLLDPQHVTLIAAFGLLALFLDVARLGPRLADVWRRHHRRVLLFGGLALLVAVSITLVNAFLFYLMVSPVGADVVQGTQVRHYFPAVILAVVLVAALFRDAVPVAPEATPRTWPRATETLALVGLSLLLVARTVELSIDLLVRYW